MFLSQSVKVNSTVTLQQSLNVFCQILQHTPNSHPDHHHLQEALARASELCNQVNEGVREKENSDQLEWLQNHVNCEGLSEVSENECPENRCAFKLNHYIM
jgi:hypothetical protein